LTRLALFPRCAVGSGLNCGGTACGLSKLRIGDP
jgi:hypothetical protein